MEENSQNELTYFQGFKTGDFLENSHRIIYRIEVDENFCYLYELDVDGKDIPSCKRKKIRNEIMDGLLRNRHFSRSKGAKRISYGDLETNLEFNRLIPK